MTCSEIEELKELKINVSTQFVASLLATLEIANAEKSKLKKNQSKKEKIEVSPYIIENKTNKPVIVHRTIQGEKADIELPPLFKGALKLSDNANTLMFTDPVCKRRHQISLEQYGYIRMPRYTGHL